MELLRPEAPRPVVLWPPAPAGAAAGGEQGLWLIQSSPTVIFSSLMLFPSPLELISLLLAMTLCEPLSNGLEGVEKSQRVVKGGSAQRGALGE